MPRVARLNYMVENGVYHVISRTVLERYFEDYEKDKLVEIIKHFSLIYFTKIYGYCIMGNHFHLIVQMNDGKDKSEKDLKKRYALYKKWCVFNPKFSIDEKEVQEYLRKKWSNISEFVKEIKQAFTRYYNAANSRRGYLWGGRYKSVLLEKGEALINCMAYIDLNPIRAKITDKPEDYRWNTLYYHVVKKNKYKWLSLDYRKPYKEEEKHKPMNKPKSDHEKFIFYRRYLYTMGKESTYKTYGKEVHSTGTIPENEFNKAKEQGFEYNIREEFKYRCRYFTDALIVGSKEFVTLMHGQYKNKLLEKRKRKFPKLKIFGDIYSMRDLRKDVFLDNAA